MQEIFKGALLNLLKLKISIWTLIRLNLRSHLPVNAFKITHLVYELLESFLFGKHLNPFVKSGLMIPFCLTWKGNRDFKCEWIWTDLVLLNQALFYTLKLPQTHAISGTAGKQTLGLAIFSLKHCLSIQFYKWYVRQHKYEGQDLQYFLYHGSFFCGSCIYESRWLYAQLNLFTCAWIVS